MQESDRQPPHECLVCLRKLHFAIGFDITERYQNMQKWFEKHEFVEEVSRLEERLKVLAGNNSNNVNSNDEAQ